MSEQPPKPNGTPPPDLTTLIPGSVGARFVATITVSLMKGAGQITLTELSAGRVKLEGTAQVPVMGDMPLAIAFDVAPDGSAVGWYGGGRYPGTAESEAGGLVIRLGKTLQHRCRVTPDGQGGLRIKASLKKRPNLDIRLTPAD
ncbi:hypothetical protein CCR85_04605 [Rhodothalassium salexigens]|uniref:Uncharacterized protein n=1 Tax=Rhodothalassium salexigens DSM 2132 TaxID=1188247 RepID=A0A4R2PKJ2_RHOSA|nr:hypothetical protein [Rhodothalassium salexigens]MBB4211383.1 hypothetical protein [Rhodothalassium salexigens DSM 2132]MBK1637716.1 hypothetical protein [Rhodothalassium salexigens DSM 2132]MBK5910773.1 hypothetical protein [Rhodothalassium salexigens]MBK5920519.1 hypothetical protein [Rhodothalassium salexigens]TCP35304.1 hypothetical protein EV659_104155 [Rhodothalassium salexigens DSM 2132]